MTDRAQWLAERRTGIGGSDVAAILGMSPWRSPLDVYLDKIGEASEQPDSPAMLWGRALEPVIRQRFADVTGLSIAVASGIQRHPTEPHMIASLDGLVLHDEAPVAVFEAKTARTAEGWGPDGTDEVPDYYAVQVQHYMAVTGLPRAFVAALIGGSDFRIYVIDRDDETIEALVDVERDFWHRHVLARVPPPPRSDAEAAARFARAQSAGEVEADADVREALERLRVARERLAEWGGVEADAKSAIQAFLGEREVLTIGGKPAATWKTLKPVARVDLDALRKAHPEIVARFTQPGAPSRRFTLKEIKA